jgi:hypothetical protein
MECPENGIFVYSLREIAIALCYAAMVFAADKGRFALVDGKEQRPPSLR